MIADPTLPAAREGYAEGQFLIAMPTIGDPRFERSLIFMFAHSAEGAMGLVVNRRSKRLTFPELLVQLEVIGAEDAIRLPERASAIDVLRGGPVERGRGFVLHSPDYPGDTSTLRVGADVSLTATLDILRAIARGEGPHRAMLALGYAGWGPGQLDAEIQANGWLTCEADPALLFDTDHESKYERALKLMGIDPAMLSGDAGHA